MVPNEPLSNSDHDLLQRIDERVSQLPRMMEMIEHNRRSINTLFTDAAKWGALGGMIVSIIVGVLIYTVVMQMQLGL